MNQYSMVVLIVLAVMCAGAFKHWAKLQHEKLRSRQDKADDATSKRIAELEDRVRVLERIVTDKSERLKQEIDAL
ncbi:MULTISPECIES: hypothetical protein [Kordiimonas]|jgi:hypothetical protein|uniref:Phage shock protein B n=1 Tax=Kordiimonas lacus TaxID=637679 RepID=A0A1G7EVY3_9PROT|nr:MULTISPECIES: hypothetical protein [Kordiimonas]SDE67853.1 hypothetical protein SAMN04488071_3509 [Kordiimonas lacus]